jgi:hypothetical protein
MDELFWEDIAMMTEELNSIESNIFDFIDLKLEEITLLINS